MRGTKRVWRLGMFGLAAVAVTIVAACSAGVTTEEFEAIRQQLAAEQEKAAVLSEQIAGKEREVAQREQEAATLEEQLREQQQVTVLVSAVPKEIPPPPPPPTPPPAGFEPPPPPRPPAEYEEAVGPFAFYVESLTAGGVTPHGLAFNESCLLNSVFKRGTKIVWRTEVIDLSTNKRVIGAEQPSVKVVLPHGEEVTARFSQRGGGRVPGAPWSWGAAWVVPPDYPVGSLDFSIVVTTQDGRTGTFKMPYSGTQIQVID